MRQIGDVMFVFGDFVFEFVLLSSAASVILLFRESHCLGDLTALGRGVGSDNVQMAQCTLVAAVEPL